ncbi:hypothetical protein [Pantoea sp. SORGH_AS_0659]|uniref:hypothetical protein n=1 Tax=Pantoea sp. SORGH_AS_0659 TaxID=3062597 RepID=UPI0028544A2D|nr:hypothetical protein [Pantoea sp. SORGH_AS_0659]MDR6352582.1 hypothetical protein [Pantoea sp. SORGH_AS_0659]
MIKKIRQDIMREALLDTYGCLWNDVEKNFLHYDARRRSLHIELPLCEAALTSVRQHIISLGRKLTVDIDRLSKKSGCTQEDVLKQITSLQQLLKISGLLLSLEKNSLQIEKPLTFLLNTQEILCTLIMYFSIGRRHPSKDSEQIVWSRKDRCKLMKLIFRMRLDLCQLQSAWQLSSEQWINDGMCEETSIAPRG